MDWNDIKTALGMIAFLGFIVWRIVDDNYEPEPDIRFASPPAMVPAPSSLLVSVDAHGAVDGQGVQVVEYADAEVVTRGARFHENEFLLHIADQGEALLVQGWRGDPNHWLFLRSLEVPAPFTPTWAGGVRRGSRFQVEGRRCETTDLLLSRPKPAKGLRAGTPWRQPTLYGFVARSGDEWLLCRWDEKEIRWYLGRRLSPDEVAAAFSPRL